MDDLELKIHDHQVTMLGRIKYLSQAEIKLDGSQTHHLHERVKYMSKTLSRLKIDPQITTLFEKIPFVKSFL